jgi:hypothetical protein
MTRLQINLSSYRKKSIEKIKSLKHKQIKISADFCRNQKL